MEKVKINVNGTEYINIFTRIIWSGGINGTSRRLEVEYVNDRNITELGDTVEFYFEDEKLFIGRVFNISKNGETKIKRFFCYDSSIYLNKNRFVKNIYTKKPS